MDEAKIGRKEGRKDKSVCPRTITGHLGQKVRLTLWERERKKKTEKSNNKNDNNDNERMESHVCVCVLACLLVACAS